MTVKLYLRVLEMRFQHLIWLPFSTGDSVLYTTAAKTTKFGPPGEASLAQRQSMKKVPDNL